MSDQQPRRYSEREIGAILKRATELQEHREAAIGAAPEGLTLEEIEEIAREVGVDAHLVRQAATEASTGTLDQRWPILGAPLRTKHEIMVAGRPAEATLDAMVVEIRNQLGQKGRFEKLNGALTWTRQNSGTKDEITITPEREGTRIRSEQFFFGSSMLLFFLPLFFTLLLGGSYLAEEVGMPALLEFALLTMAMLTVFGLGRIGFKLWTRQQSQKMATLIQSLSAMLASSPPPEDESVPAPIEVPEAASPEISERTHQRARTR